MIRLRLCRMVLLLSLAALTAPCAEGFSLLGPFLDQTNRATFPWQGRPYGGRPGGLGYELKGDIGGPMSRQEAYRWTLPTIYYGFDASFLEYFGQPGVAAVEQAMAILNALPPASRMSSNLTEFPLEARAMNLGADALRLLDLKSHTLPLLLEQLGLANPGRFVWGLRDRQVIRIAGQAQTNYVVQNLNYDPVTLATTHLLNGVRYNFSVFDSLGPKGEEWASAVEWYQLDPQLTPYSAVANSIPNPDFGLGSEPNLLNSSSGLFPGMLFTGLTRDDVGGLRHLLRRDNKVWETLPPGVTGAGPNATRFVSTALRGGVEKLTFARLPFDTNTGRFRAVTHRFQDVYYTNNRAVSQTVQRVVTKPDITFSARDLGGIFYDWYEPGNIRFVPSALVERSGTGHWQNNSALNNPIPSGGPGQIAPGAQITFSTLGRYRFGWQWGSFDTSATLPILHAGRPSATDYLSLGTRVATLDGVPTFQWGILGEWQRVYTVASSTNLIHWTPLYSVTNDTLTFTISQPVETPTRFFKVEVETPR